jgi:hypothetical protein
MKTYLIGSKIAGAVAGVMLLTGSSAAYATKAPTPNDSEVLKINIEEKLQLAPLEEEHLREGTGPFHKIAKKVIELYNSQPAKSLHEFEYCHWQTHQELERNSDFNLTNKELADKYPSFRQCLEERDLIRTVEEDGNIHCWMGRELSIDDVAKLLERALDLSLETKVK